MCFNNKNINLMKLYRNFINKFLLIIKTFFKVTISLIIGCFIIKLCLKLLRLETSPIIWELYFKVKKILPNFVINIIFKRYEDIEYYLWLFMYFFANFIEFAVYFLFKIQLRSRPYDFIGLILICFFMSILWILLFKKKR